MHKETIIAAVITAIATVIAAIITVRYTGIVPSKEIYNENSKKPNIVLEEQYNNLLAQNNSLSDECKSLKSELEATMDSNEKKDNLIDDLNDEIAEQKEIIASQEKEIEELKRRIIPSPTPTLLPTPMLTPSPSSMPIYDDSSNNDIISIFTLETFQGLSYWMPIEEIAVDTYGNEYSFAFQCPHGRVKTKNEFSPIYLLDYKYSKCEGEIAWLKTEKNDDSEC